MFSKSQCYIEEDIERYSKVINQKLDRNPIFKGEFPRLIDEWQDLPTIWDKTRLLIDFNQKPGQFILTGSTRVNRNKIRHSGAGRFSKIKMSTLTFYEILREKVDDFISIEKLFDNKDEFKSMETDYSLFWIGENMIIGGWPSAYLLDEKERDNSNAKKYVDSIENTNTYISLKPRRITIQKLIRSIARLNGSQLNYSTILKDLKDELKKIHYRNI